MKYTSTVLFAGAGLMDCAIADTGGRIVTAIEWEEKVAKQYHHNFPEVRLLVQSVQSIAPNELEPTDHIHLSPPCTEASIANPNAIESDASISAAFASLKIIQSIHCRGGARWITLENVWGYRNFQSFAIILNGLRQLGYAIGYQKLNAADFGVPQNRERLWLRAVRSDSIQSSRQLSLFGDDELLPLCGMKKRVSWWEALAPIASQLPQVKLASYQIKRFESWLSLRFQPDFCLLGKEKNQVALKEKPSFTITKSIYKDLPVLLKRAGANTNSCAVVSSRQPSPTVLSLNGRTDQFNVLLLDYTVRRLTPEALWILQMYGCHHVYSWKPGTSNTLKCKAIGNGVAYLNARGVLESLFARSRNATIL